MFSSFPSFPLTHHWPHTGAAVAAQLLAPPCPGSSQFLDNYPVGLAGLPLEDQADLNLGLGHLAQAPQEDEEDVFFHPDEALLLPGGQEESRMAPGGGAGFLVRPCHLPADLSATASPVSLLRLLGAPKGRDMTVAQRPLLCSLRQLALQLSTIRPCAGIAAAGE